MLGMGSSSAASARSAAPPATATTTVLLKLATHVRGALLVAPWLAWLLAADALLSLLLVAKPVAPTAVYAASSAVAAGVWRWVQWIFTAANGARIGVSGDALPAGESAVVVANHRAYADFYMVQALALRAGMLGRCRYFAKSQLRWVPFLGWGLWAMGMPLVSRHWDKDRAELDRVFRGIVERRWPVWLVSYSEATRFTPRKYAESQAWCAAHDRPQPRHLLYPRTKGFVSTVQHLRRAPHVNAVYDLTIAYQRDGSQAGWMQPPTMWQTLSVANLSGHWPTALAGGSGIQRHADGGEGKPEEASDIGSGQGWRFHVHARRFPLDELPLDDEGLAKWLEQRWVEKGAWLEAKRLEWTREKIE